MKRSVFLSLMALVLFSIAGAPVVAMTTGLTLIQSAGAVAAGVLTINLINGPAVSGALFVNSPDVSAITSAFVQFGGDVLRKHVNMLEIAGDNFYKFYRNLQAPVVLTRLASAGNIRPYAKAAATNGNEPTFTDRTLTAHAGKWDFDIDFEEFRNTYLASGEDKPFYQVMLDKYGEDFWAQVNDSVAGNGVRNAGGSAAADVTNGWLTHLQTAIDDTDITEVTTGAVSANGVDAILDMIGELPVWMRNTKGASILMSYDSFDAFTADYRATYGYTFQPRAVNEYVMDNTNIRLKACSWMGNSGRLIATVPGTLAWGTDGKGLKMYATETRNIIEVRALGAVGFQIADLDAIKVSDVA